MCCTPLRSFPPCAAHCGDLYGWTHIFKRARVHFTRRCAKSSTSWCETIFKKKFNQITELEVTEQKTTGQISASSQSSIAALKDVLAYGRLTSSPPLPPPLHALAHYRPPLYPISIPIGAVCGWSQRVWGGGREQSSSTSRFLGKSGALSALKQIVHISSSLERLFHSVIFLFCGTQILFTLVCMQE